MSYRLLNSDGEIGSEYPSMSMIAIGLLLHTLRQRWRCLLYDVYWLPVGYCMWVAQLNNLEYNSSNRKENTLCSRAPNNQIKPLNRTKHWIEQSTESHKVLNPTKHWMNKSPTIITSNKRYRHCMVWAFQKSLTVTVQYLHRLNILVITESTIETLFCSCVSSWGISSCAAEFHFLPAGSLMALWKIHGTPQHPMWPHA